MVWWEASPPCAFPLPREAVNRSSRTRTRSLPTRYGRTDTPEEGGTVSAQPLHRHTAVPQPSATPEALRAALAQVAPGRLAAFDADRARSTDRAREQTSSDPLRRFVERWAIEVAVERHPENAARLRELQARAELVSDAGEARRIAVEISSIRAAAAAEAGVPAIGAGSGVAR